MEWGNDFLQQSLSPNFASNSFTADGEPVFDIADNAAISVSEFPDFHFDESDLLNPDLKGRPNKIDTSPLQNGTTSRLGSSMPVPSLKNSPLPSLSAGTGSNQGTDDCEDGALQKLFLEIDEAMKRPHNHLQGMNKSFVWDCDSNDHINLSNPSRVESPKKREEAGKEAFSESRASLPVPAVGQEELLLDVSPWDASVQPQPHVPLYNADLLRLFDDAKKTADLTTDETVKNFTSSGGPFAPSMIAQPTMWSQLDRSWNVLENRQELGTGNDPLQPCELPSEQSGMVRYPRLSSDASSSRPQPVDKSYHLSVVGQAGPDDVKAGMRLKVPKASKTPMKRKKLSALPKVKLRQSSARKVSPSTSSAVDPVLGGEGLQGVAIAREAMPVPWYSSFPGLSSHDSTVEDWFSALRGGQEADEKAAAEDDITPLYLTVQSLNSELNLETTSQFQANCQNEAVHDARQRNGENDSDGTKLPRPTIPGVDVDEVKPFQDAAVGSSATVVKSQQEKKTKGAKNDKLSVEERLEKKRIRAIRNRQSAEKSRRRRKAYSSMMESKVVVLRGISRQWKATMKNCIERLSQYQNEVRSKEAESETPVLNEIVSMVSDMVERCPNTFGTSGAQAQVELEIGKPKKGKPRGRKTSCKAQNQS